MSSNMTQPLLPHIIELPFDNIDKYAPPIGEPGLSILYVNARSLKNKIDDLQWIAQHYFNHVSIIVVAETWFVSGQEKFFNLPNFSAHHNVREKHAGGVTVFVKESIPSIVIKSIELLHSLLLIEVVFNRQVICILGGYRPPDGPKDLFLRDLEVCLTLSENKQIIVAGDFNINLFDQSSEYYRDFLSSYNVFILNQLYSTRITESSQTLIDHIISNMIQNKITISNIIHDFSDHNLLVIDISPNNLSDEHGKSAVINSKVNYKKLSHYFRSHIFDSSKTNIDEHICDFLEFIQVGVNISTYKIVKQGTQSLKHEWMTPDLLRMIQWKNYLFSKTRGKNASEEVKREYRSYAKIVTVEKRRVKNKYYANKIDSAGSSNRHTWAVLKDLLKIPKSKNSVTELVYEGKNFCESQDIAECFASFFAQVAPALSNKLGPPPYDPCTLIEGNSSSMFLYPVTEKEVIDAVSDLKLTGDGYTDCLSTYLLKNCKAVLIRYIFNIVDLSFTTKKFPSIGKIARVITIYKGGDVSDPGNYRPISTLHVIAKVIEKVMKQRLVKFVNKSNIFYKFQYGFRTSSSPLNAIIDALDPIYKTLDDGGVAGGIFLDLAKAFDTVDHGILLNKLRLYGFRGPVYEWLESYITQRYFYVSINGYNSGKYLSTLGVPQGSVLGPLLFLLYINDIGRLNLHGRTMLFADDTGLFYTGTDPHVILQDMQSDINLISEWFVANRLTVNPSKSHYLFFTKDCVTLDTPITVPSSNQTINRVTCVKYLGLYIDESLSWKTHIEYITKKIAPIVGILYRFRFMSLPRSLKLNLYYSMIHPHISFMNCIWSAASNLLVYGIEVLQRRALKNIFNKSLYIC